MKYISRTEQTNNLDVTLNVKAGMDRIPGPQTWQYNATASGANNSAAEVAAANYFSPVVVDPLLGSAHGIFKVGDLIYASCNDPVGQGMHVATMAAGASTVDVLY